MKLADGLVVLKGRTGMGGLVVLLAIGALVVASKGEQEDQMPQDIYCGDMNCYEVLLDFIVIVFLLCWAEPQ